MRDAERLELLKEVGGTRVYEERRRESVKLMHECEAKRERIRELVSHGLRVGGWGGEAKRERAHQGAGARDPACARLACVPRRVGRVWRRQGACTHARMRTHARCPPLPPPPPTQIEGLDARLGELNAEREELVAYQGLDRTRRCLEYAIFDRELAKLRGELDKASECTSVVWVGGGGAGWVGG